MHAAPAFAIIVADAISADKGKENFHAMAMMLLF